MRQVGFVLCFVAGAVARAPSVALPDAVGWWLGAVDDASFPASAIDWDLYTHITLAGKNGGVTVDSSGTANCNLTTVAPLRDIVHSHGAKALVGAGGLNMVACLDHNKTATPNNTQYKAQYLASIGSAMDACGVDGIEIDYEWDDIPRVHTRGQITHAEATVYSLFLGQIKQSIGPNRTVSVDISTWGLSRNSYPLEIHPWVNASMLNQGIPDWVNTMSYHWPTSGSILDWKEDGFGLHTLQGIDKNRVNIGIPYYSMGSKSHPGEPTWGGLSPLCPNLAPDSNECGGVAVVGKKMNMEIGAWIKADGWRGVFPWAADYDASPTDGHNNTLAGWLAEGLLGR